MPHLNSINEPPPFSDNSYALNANFQIISLTDTGYIPLLTELISHSCERSTLWVVPLDSFLNCGPADWTQDGQALYDWATPQPPRSTSAVSVVEVFPWPLIWGQLCFAAFCTFFARLLVLWRLGWHLLTHLCWADDVSSIGLLKSILPGAPGSCPFPPLPSELWQLPAWDHLWTCRHTLLLPAWDLHLWTCRHTL